MRFLTGQFFSGLHRMSRPDPRGYGHLGAVALTCLLGMAGLGSCDNLFSDHASQDEAGVSALDSGSVLPELVVDLDDHLSDGQVRDFERRYGARFAPESSYVRHDRIYRVSIPGVGAMGSENSVAARMRQLGRLLTALRRDVEVEAADWALLYRIPESTPTSLIRTEDEAISVTVPAVAEPAKQDGPGRDRFLPNDPKFKFQWHLDQIRMPEAWTRNQGDGVVVAVVDTGVTPVEDLSGTEIVPGWNFVDNTPDARDDHGHGIYVVGTIV